MQKNLTTILGLLILSNFLIFISCFGQGGEPRGHLVQYVIEETKYCGYDGYRVVATNAALVETLDIQIFTRQKDGKYHGYLSQVEPGKKMTICKYDNSGVLIFARLKGDYNVIFPSTDEVNEGYANYKFQRDIDEKNRLEKEERDRIKEAERIRKENERIEKQRIEAEEKEAREQKAKEEKEQKAKEANRKEKEGKAAKEKNTKSNPTSTAPPPSAAELNRMQLERQQNEIKTASNLVGVATAALLTTEGALSPVFLQAKGRSLDFKADVGYTHVPILMDFSSPQNSYSQTSSADVFRLNVAFPFWLFRSPYFGVGGSPEGSAGILPLSDASATMFTYGGYGSIMAGSRRIKIIYQFGGVKYHMKAYEQVSTYYQGTYGATQYTIKGEGKAEPYIQRSSIGLFIDFSGDANTEDEGYLTLAYSYDKISWNKSSTLNSIKFSLCVGMGILFSGEYSNNYFVSGNRLYTPKDELNNGSFYQFSIGKIWNIANRIRSTKK